MARQRQVERIGGKKFVKWTKRLCQGAVHYSDVLEQEWGVMESLGETMLAFMCVTTVQGPGGAARRSWS